MLYNANDSQVRASKAYKTMTKSDVQEIYDSKERYKALWYARQLAINAKDHTRARRLRHEAITLQEQIYRKYDIIL